MGNQQENMTDAELELLLGPSEHDDYKIAIELETPNVQHGNLDLAIHAGNATKSTEVPETSTPALNSPMSTCDDSKITSYPERRSSVDAEVIVKTEYEPRLTAPISWRNDLDFRPSIRSKIQTLLDGFPDEIQRSLAWEHELFKRVYSKPNYLSHIQKLMSQIESSLSSL